MKWSYCYRAEVDYSMSLSVPFGFYNSLTSLANDPIVSLIKHQHIIILFIDSYV